ncbi:MAG: IS1634 family transposase [Parcubacteria group bacterium]|nr:IS1634 family transposase [Parcubacteria group bacterium]
MRRVKTSSGATAVQIAHKQYGRIKRIEHIGSAHNRKEETILVSLARARLHANQPSLFPDIQPALKVHLRSSCSGLLRRVLLERYYRLGFRQLADEVYALLCIARIVEPTSKLDSLRVLSDLGVHHIDKNQLYRCLQRVIDRDYRKTVSAVCFDRAAAGNLSLVLYDVTTLYFEAQQEDSYRKPGLSKERRLEPQIVIGLLVDQSGFPLGLHSFEGNTAETKTMLPVIEAFCSQHRVRQITVVADAAMLSAKNLSVLAQAGHHYIVGSRLRKIPYDIAEYQKTRILSDRKIIISRLNDYRIVYQYLASRAALDVKNIQKQVAKAQKIIAGKTAVSRAKFVTIAAKSKTLNQALIAKAYALAGIKGYVTNLDIPGQQVIDYYHQLFQVEASFRMAKSDFKARPIFHRKQDSIEAHLTIVLTALAIGKSLESQTGMTIKQLVKTLRPIRSGIVVINGQEYLAEEEVSPVIHTLLQKLHSGH